MEIKNLTVTKEKQDDFAPLIEVSVDDNVVLVWNEEANVDSPEDLTWGRDLSGIFEAGKKAGRYEALISAGFTRDEAEKSVFGN